MTESARSIRTVWLDVSLLMKHCDPRRPTGIPRTTAQIFRSLWSRGVTNLRLCEPADGPCGMTEVRPGELIARFPIPSLPQAKSPTVEVECGDDPPPIPGRSRWPARLVPGFARRWLRGVQRRVQRPERVVDAPSVPLVEFGSADLLLHLGGAWADPGSGAGRFEELHRRHGLRIAHLIYDLIPVLRPQFFPEGLAPVLEDYFRSTLRQSEFLLSISRRTRDDLELFATRQGIPLPPVEVVRLGENVPSDEGGVVPPAELDEARPFVLCVGTQEVRKNHHLLYQVWRRLVEKRSGRVPALVIAGAAGWLAGDVMYQFRTDPLTREHVVIVPKCDDGQLRWLYESCLFTVYPSHYEGWGLPIAESLAFGKPCIASNTSSMTEIAADLTLMADPCDAPAWLDLVERLLDPEFRSTLEGRIRRQFRRTSWDDTTDQIVGYLEGHFGQVFQWPARCLSA